jgi:hypothetical protein
MIAVGQGAEGAALALQDLQPMLVQLEVADDFRRQQPHEIGARGVAKPGQKLFRDAGPAGDVAALDHHCLEPCARQVSGAHQAIVAAADDDGVAGLGARGNVKHQDALAGSKRM